MNGLFLIRRFGRLARDCSATTLFVCVVFGFAIPVGRTVAADDSQAAAALSQQIDTEARRIVANVKTTAYSHVSHVDQEQGLYEVDCSGFVDLVLKTVSPKHFAEVKTPRGHKRPLADDYVETFVGALANPKSGGWQHVEHLRDAQPGDILAWKNPAHRKGEHTNTGHVVVIDALPIEEPIARSPDQMAYRLRVIDSTASPHASDTRGANQSGVGRGTIWIVVNASGNPIGYRWKNPRATLHLVPIGIGRAIGSD